MKILLATNFALLKEGLAFELYQIIKEAEISSYKKSEDILDALNNHAFALMIIEKTLLQSFEPAFLKKLKNSKLKTKVAIISPLETKSEIEKMISDGANGIIFQNIEPENFIKAIKSILSGRTYRSSFGKKEDQKQLTSRQKETLSLLAQGMLNKQIAFKMGISEATVKLHINALLHLFGAANRTDALMKAIRLGMV